MFERILMIADKFGIRPAVVGYALYLLSELQAAALELMYVQAGGIIIIAGIYLYVSAKKGVVCEKDCCTDTSPTVN